MILFKDSWQTFNSQNGRLAIFKSESHLLKKTKKNMKESYFLQCNVHQYE